MRAVGSSAGRQQHKYESLFGSDGMELGPCAFDRNYKAVYLLWGKTGTWVKLIVLPSQVAVPRPGVWNRGAHLYLIEVGANFHSLCHLDSEES